MNEQLQTLITHPAHAVLLTGPAAETSTGAVEVAQALLQGHEEYLRRIMPDAKSTISISQIRELLAFFQLRVPGKSAIRRMAIIEQAPAMTREAQNALLKLLEEPPTDSVLLLTAERPQDLLATIRSRLQTIHLVGEPITPETEAVQLVKQALAGTTYDRLLLVDSTLKAKETAMSFVATLAAAADAALKVAAERGDDIARWQRVLAAAYAAEDALQRSGNTKLVLSELMLSL